MATVKTPTEILLSAILGELVERGKVPVLRSAYTPHDPVHADVGEFSLTRQEFREECDVNQIMARYNANGQLPLPGAMPMYVDWTGMPSDLAGVLAFLGDAEASFMSLPALVRKEFDNDPVRFVDFATDPANLGRLQEWGLAAPLPAPPEPTLVRVVPEPATTPAANSAALGPV